MNNPHIIVGPRQRCLCGIYSGKEVTCADILSATKLLATPALNEEARRETATWLNGVLLDMVQECE
jgi:hypothetical protein